MPASSRPPSAIPVGTQFSPSLIKLPAFLAALLDHSGDKGAMEDAVWGNTVRMAPVRRLPTRRRRSLPLEAAVQYGLLEPNTYVATSLTRKLAGLASPSVYDEFARHILLNCGGLRVVEAVEQMQADSLSVTGDTLATYLTDQGFTVTVHNTAINSMRMWLAMAGLFPREGRAGLWALNREAKERVLGIGEAAVRVLSGLSADQLAFVQALCRMNPTDWCRAADVRALAEATTHLRLGRASLPDQFLEPLRAAGLIEYERGGTSGGKSARLRVTPAFRADVVEPFVTTTVLDLDAAVTAYFRTRPEDIYRDLDSKSAFVKGRALEAYAVYLMRLLGLRFLEWRKKAESTGGSEVDALFAGVSGAVPTRWQVQCKNTPRQTIDLEVVAREVGLVPMTRATHILIVANARISRDATKYASQVMQSSPVTIFLLDRADFQAVKQSPGALGSILRRKAEDILRLAPRGSAFAWKTTQP